MRRSSYVKVLAILAAVSLWSSSGMTAVAAYDASADWSGTDNPNGVWSYWVEGALGQLGTRGGDVFSDPPGAPPIWTVAEGIEYWVGWSKSNGGEQVNGWDLQIGDVYGHTGSQPMEIRWESPLAGPVQVSGGVWAIRDIGRWNNWDVTLNGTSILDGQVAHGDPYDRTNPAPMTLALDVAVGDVLAFRALPGDPDYIAVKFSVTPDVTATIPAPGAILLGTLGTGLVGWMRRRRTL